MGGMHASAIQECQGWLASPETKRKAQDRSFPAAFSWFCPHLDLGLLKPPKLSETHFCCFKPPRGFGVLLQQLPGKQTCHPGTFCQGQPALSKTVRHRPVPPSSQPSCRSPPPPGSLLRGPQPCSRELATHGALFLTGKWKPLLPVEVLHKESQIGIAVAKLTAFRGETSLLLA